jgi:LmbE family N-acetylglucosaminyl deacetylase
VRNTFLAFAAFCLGAAGTARAQQLRPAGTGGVAALANSLEQLGANKRVLVIGAHPDDEDTQLLTWLSRGLGAQAAYLALNRGEGGQNLIGPELGPELGLIRTEELLGARSVDGARQYFTRAYDFGFTKSAEESFRFWSRDSLLQDVLAVIRRFRPQVIVSIFTGTPRDGHGQHQVAGILAREAFHLLRDFTWGPAKLYTSAFFNPSAATLTIPTGTLDPVLGQSYFQIAMAGRSRHRSQDMGQLQRPGPAQTRLAFVESRNGTGGDLFDGVDTVWHGADRYRALIDSARRALNPFAPQATAPFLARALAALGPVPGRFADEQRAILDRALGEASGVIVDGIADDGVVIPGERLQVEVSVWNTGDASVAVDSVQLDVPAGWRLERLDPAAFAVAPNTMSVRRFAVTVAPDARRSEPYFLRRPLRGAMYDWTGVPDSIRGLPFQPPPVAARVWAHIAGAAVVLPREVVYRYRDQAMGEIRRPLFVTEAYDVAVTPSLIVWPVDGGGASGSSRTVTVTVTNRRRGAASGRVRLMVPPGWAPVPPESLSFTREDETQSLSFTVRPPPAPAPGGVTLDASVVDASGGVSTGALTIIDYPHIRPRPSVHPSTVEIRLARIHLPGLSRVGYVRGASDRVPESLEEVGVPITLLNAADLGYGDLSRFDAIVIGSRAYETDTALIANNDRLLDYVRGGGLLLVQYQQYPFIQGGYAPYRMSIARPHDRVTDETAPITPLRPDNPVFHSPNDIGPSDWEGWVQERGLYFAHDWDSTYVPLLETHDPGGPPLEGGLLVAPLGRGTYVYTGLSFFRQLPAGVVGAYRLFANLLGLKASNVP